MATLGDEDRVILDNFCLDRTNECLLRGAQVIKLRPKAFAVLNQLVGRTGQLVTKEELLNTVWTETFVGDAVLKVTIIAAELAMHFEQGRDYMRAAKYLQRASDNAIRRFAYQESIKLGRRGLEMLEKLPDTVERAQQELCLQLTLGVALIVTGGYASEDVGNTYTRARELCRRIGATPDISEALWGLWAFNIVRAELKTAHEIAQEFLHLGERLPYPGLAMRGHEAMEVSCAQMGQFPEAIEHFEKALALYDPEQHLEDAFL